MSTKKKSKRYVYELTYLGPEKSLPIDPRDGGVYLLLNEQWHVTAWVEGGDVPISLASTYLGPERKFTMTTDETWIKDSSANLSPLAMAGVSLINTTLGGISNINGFIVPPVKNASIYREDGIILSFSYRRGSELARRLGGKKACVRIKDLDRLKKVIDVQLNVIGILDDCSYTDDDNKRHHFLKSTLDSWQDEIRMFWRVNASKTVTLPPGIAEFVEYY